MTKDLIDTNATKKVDGRATPQFAVPTKAGWQRLCTTSCLQGKLSVPHLEEDQDDDTQGELDVDYEYADVV